MITTERVLPTNEITAFVVFIHKLFHNSFGMFGIHGAQR